MADREEFGTGFGSGYRATAAKPAQSAGQMGEVPKAVSKDEPKPESVSERVRNLVNGIRTEAAAAYDDAVRLSALLPSGPAGDIARTMVSRFETINRHVHIIDKM